MNPNLDLSAPRRFSRILVTRADRLGDLVLSTPVFSSLRRAFPNARIACLTFLENREAVEGNPFLDEVILYEKKGSEKGIAGNLFFASRLARKKFDLVIHLHATRRMHFVSWLAGIPVRIGWRRKCAWALTHSFEDIKKEGKKHEAQYNFDLLKPLGVCVPDTLETFFPLSEKARLSFEMLADHLDLRRDKPWMVLNPSASCPSKIWPPERFGDLVEKISEKYDFRFIAIGTRKDRPRVEKLKSRTRTAVYDLSGKLTLGMLGILLKDSALLISNDSGPVHIASAVGTPVVSIFGRNQPGLSPARWGPLSGDSRIVWKDVGCPKCLAHNCQIHFLCLDAVSVEDVLQAARELLTRRLALQ